MKPLEPFEKFLNDHFIFVLGVLDQGQPYTAPCFYAYDPGTKTLIFVSERHTQHIKGGLAHAQVSGSVFHQTENLGDIQGVQFKGRLCSEFSEDHVQRATELFCKRFPYARIKRTPVWAIELLWVKFTDHTRGFAFKEVWENHEPFSLPCGKSSSNT